MTRITAYSVNGEPYIDIEEIDPDAPYYVVRRVLRSEDSGAWTDIPPDVLPAELPDIPTLIFPGGLYRSRLLDIGVTRSAWKRASGKTRILILRSFEALSLIEGAVKAAIESTDPRLRRRAEEYLDTHASLPEASASSRGFMPFLAKSAELRVAPQLLARLTAILREAEQENRSGRFRRMVHEDSTRASAYLARLNQVVGEFRIVGTAPQAKTEDLRALRTVRASTVSRRIALRALPALTADDLKLGRVRRRAKKSGGAKTE